MTGCHICIQKTLQSSVKDHEDVAKTAVAGERCVPMEPEDILESIIPFCRPGNEQEEEDCPDSPDTDDTDPTDTRPLTPDDIEMAMLVYKDTTKVKKMVRKIVAESVPEVEALVMDNRREIDELDTKIQHGNEKVSDVVKMVGWMKENLDYVQETLLGNDTIHLVKNPYYAVPGDKEPESGETIADNPTDAPIPTNESLKVW